MTSPAPRSVTRARRRPALLALAVAIVAAACAPVAAAPAHPPSAESTSRAAIPAITPAPRSAAEAALLVTPPEVDVVPGAPLATPAPAAPLEPYAMAIGTGADWIQQYTFEWCVGASLQMTATLLRASSDRSRARQQVLWEMARDRSDSPFGGANPRGWTAALNDLGLGPYALASRPTFDGAVRAAAAALRSTGRPVGLVMWAGRHAWVMSGFTSLGDPVLDPGFQVTGIRVLDPLYPYGDDKWGPSPRPGSLVTPEMLAAQFVARGSGRVDLGVAPGFLLILPVPA